MDAGVALLEREMYSEAEAARLLRVPQSTLHYWLEGRTQAGTTYLPILRVAATGRRTVTWAEFVEAGLLKQYRRDLKVPMLELRRFISILRDRLGVPYPLATSRPWSSGDKLVIEAQDEAELPREYWLYAPVGDQGLLLPPGDSFLRSVELEDGIAKRWKPDPASPVLLDPDQRFGHPSVRGISTTVLWEYAQDGYTDAEIAADFGLAQSDVSWAVAYETDARAA